MGNTAGATYDLTDHLTQMQLPATGQTGPGRGKTVASYLYPGGPPKVSTQYDESNVQVRQITVTYGAEGESLATTGSTEVAGMTYDPLYRVVTLADGNSQVTTYNYNAAGYLASVVYPGTDTVQHSSYDAAGNLLQRIDGRGLVTNYVYGDADGYLTQVQYPATPALNVAFTYDTYGRRALRTDGVGS